MNISFGRFGQEGPAQWPRNMSTRANKALGQVPHAPTAWQKRSSPRISTEGSTRQVLASLITAPAQRVRSVFNQGADSGAIM